MIKYVQKERIKPQLFTRFKNSAVVWLILLSWSMALVQVQAQWEEATKALASDAQANDNFGWSVSISGDYAIVGARYEDAQGSNAGAAYIFKRSGAAWAQEQKITASDAQAGDDFGYAVSISGDYAIVGARYEDAQGSNAGAAYIFKRSTTSWAEEQKITASDAQIGDLFGHSVAISGDYAIVGALREDAAASDAGAAYIFKHNGSSWAQEQKITASDAQAGDDFGYDVSISGDYAIVGARYESAGGSNAGAAYIFKRNGSTWAEEQKITASDAQANDRFGFSVSISGDYALAGAAYEDDAASDAGAAYVFKRSGTTWTQEQKITAPDAQTNDYFGWSVSLSGDHALIGAYREDEAASDAGAAYIFKRNGSSWTQEQKITASDAQANDDFGFCVAISGDNAIVGAITEDAGGSDAGAAYIFRAVPEINVQGNGIDILDGASSPSLANHTDFGTVGTAGKTLRYTIQNLGKTALNLSSISSDNPDFVIAGFTAGSSVAGYGSATFDVVFTPTGANGSKSASISIHNNDADESVYDFTVEGYKINETVQGTRGNMINLDGSGDYIDCGTGVNVASTGTFTLEGWVYLNNTSQNQVFFGERNTFVWYHNGNGLRCEFRNSANSAWRGNFQDGGGSPSLNANEWYHIAATFGGSGTTLKVYINGDLAAETNPISDSPYNPSETFAIGRWGVTNDRYTDGKIDEVRVWDDVRTEAEIRENMHLTLDGSEPSLVAYYQFNEASGNVIDKVAGNNGTLMGDANRIASEVAVASGTSKIVNVSSGSAGTYEVDLSTTNCAIDFGSGTNPNGDLVIYQLNERPHTPPSGVFSTSSYWVVRNFGTNTTGLDINSMRFQIPNGDALNNGDVAADFNLYKQASADFNNWGTAAVTGASSVDFANRTITFAPSFGSFSQFIVGSTGNSTLPIELLDFQAQRSTATQVALNWSTATEINASHFEVERMLDNEEVFTKVGEVAATGTSNSFQAYAFQDANAHQGLSYYRLKQVDEDGSFEYSEIRTVAGKELDRQIAVFPNPVDEVLKLRLSELSGQQQVDVRIVNSIGQVVFQGQRTFGQADVVEVREVADLVPGAYYLQLNWGAEQMALPFVKR